MNRDSEGEEGEVEPASVSDLNWLLDDLVERAVGARHAVVLSADGVLIGKSWKLSEEDGEHLSAMASAFQSLARGAGRYFDGGEVRQTIVEMDHAFLFVTAGGKGTCLAVLAEGSPDAGTIAYEMNLLVRKVGSVVSSPPRAQERSAAHAQVR